LINHRTEMKARVKATKTMKLKLRKEGKLYYIYHTDLNTGDVTTIASDSDLDRVCAVWDKQVEIDARIK